MVKRNKLFIIFILFVLVGCTSNANLVTDTDDANATEDIPLDPLSETEYYYATPSVKEISPPNFTLYNEEPVLTRSQGWDSVFLFPGAIIFHDGLFHMLYSGNDGQENQSPLENIGYAVSSDGFAWVRALDEPVQFTGQPEYELSNLVVSSLLVGNDGNWVMYFIGKADQSNVGGSFIGRASAPNLAGPWTIDPEPALLPGNPARWDGGGVSKPQVFKTVNGFVMYFNGLDGDMRFLGPTQIGMATSSDGITWTKFNDPETTSRRFEDSDPIFKVGPDSSWDSTNVSLGAIMRTQKEWVMLYFGVLNKDAQRIRHLGYAASVNGITWERYKGNPILNLTEFMPNHYIYGLLWIYEQDKQILYFSAFHPSLGITEVYLATSE